MFSVTHAGTLQIIKKKLARMTMRAYEAPGSRSLGEVLRRVFQACHHPPASLLDLTGMEVTAWREPVVNGVWMRGKMEGGNNTGRQ